MVNFEEVIVEKRELIWRQIRPYLCDPVYPESFKIPPEFESEAKFHWQIVREYPQRKGKYLRPILVLLTASAMGAKEQTALKAAAAMQVSEDWILGHDDFEDDSLVRRGKPALHRLYGNELAVNAGDSLHVIMWKIILDCRADLGSEKTFALGDEFYRMLARTTLGQSTEIRWTKKNKTDFTDQDWFFIADGKTSYYTISGPMRLGAIVAGADQSQLDALANFGIHLGRSFQLTDDVLDLTGDFGGLKKQTANDIYEGKRTAILGHLLRIISGPDKKKLLTILGKSRAEKSADEVAWVLARMKKYKSIDYARALALKEAGIARQIFKAKLGFLAKTKPRRDIDSFIHFVTERSY